MPNRRWMIPNRSARYANRKCHWTDSLVFPFLRSIATVAEENKKMKETIPRYTTKGIPAMR
ncbi:MAG: hypothetical protein JW840_11125 [Candidatus Thermoplasmatota archaeon]|nr:hypothetical protein [Candidatus Thermoplasmatota archaeon]